MSDQRANRIALNESAFRELNESLEANVHRSRANGRLAGFVCECGDGDCEAIVQLDLSAYEAIRRDSQLFFVVPGHEIPDVEDVVDDGDGHYLVVRKHVDVAGLVDDTDPRTGADG
jgi:hypothetical protein